MEFLQTWNTDCFTCMHIFMYGHARKESMPKAFKYTVFCIMSFDFIVLNILCVKNVAHVMCFTHSNRTAICTTMQGEK